MYLIFIVQFLILCANVVSAPIEDHQYSDEIGPPQIITAPPKRPDNFELVVGTRFGQSGPVKATRMANAEDQIYNMGQFGLRLPIAQNRRPSFQNGFRPKPFIPVMRNRPPAVMLPRLPNKPKVQRGPKRPDGPRRAAGIIVTPVKPSSVAVLSPVKEERKPLNTPWPNIGVPGRPIGMDVVKHLIKNVGGNIQDEETSDSKPAVRYLRPTRRTTTVPPKTTTVPTTKNIVWPTGRVVPVSRPSWHGKLNIATATDEKDGRDASLSDPEIDDSTSLNVGIVEIKPLKNNETESTVRSPSRPSYASPMTTENLAYILIGSCTVLSITFLVIVAVTIHCRKVFRRKRMVRDLRKAGYFRPMTWAREQRNRANADQYLHGVKRAPKTRLMPWFTLRRSNRALRTASGALRYETVGIGNNKRIKRTTVALPNGVFMADGRRKANVDMESFSTSGGEGTCPCTASSHISDEFDDSSDSGGCHREHCRYRCHCVKERQYRCCCSPHRMCSNNRGPECKVHGHKSPPVSGSNYLSNPDGQIFWSGNNDRLI